MFVRSQTDKRVVVIVDISGLFYKYAFGGASALQATIKVDGVPRVVDTTLPAYTIKQLHRWSNYGFNPLAVCFDGAGANKSRKAYFAKYNGIREGAEPVGYKGTREIQDNRFYEGVNLTRALLQQGGVPVYQAEGYEADDLIKAAVDRAKIQYPDLPIHVITGDQDLIPLVDDQVSVFLASRKTTYAEEPEHERRGYVQLTPRTYDTYVSTLTEFSKLLTPYNTVLLKKLLRGKKADEIPAYPKFTPTKYNKLIESLVADGYDLTTLFRYDAPVATICYRGTEEPIPLDLVDSTPKERKMIKFSEPKVITEMCDLLSHYLDDDIIRHIRFIYNGINLNAAFTGLPEMFMRRPAQLTSSIEPYLASQLQYAVGQVQINLPRN